MKYERQVFLKETFQILLTEHLSMLCQILDAASESEALEAERSNVA